MFRTFTGLLILLASSVSVRAQDAPLPPAKAPLAMKLPEGFRASLVASEPTLVKPIAMTLDDRGRLWVVESHSYPHWLKDGQQGTDRILIFEPKKGSAEYDCKVFLDRGTNISGIEVGFGGVWLCATPNLLFIPMRPGADKPAGPAQVVLDGWSPLAKHNVFNSLIWGPDGWLYGCNGITATSRVGKPGTPDSERVPFNCGVWRYHPIKQRFEPFAWGTTNPWGLDFDDFGEAFITNCVIKHLFHVVPGAHFQRMFGDDLNPHCYGLIESCADHIHWAGGAWASSRGGQGAHDETGGGHAHAGAMIYLGDNWPGAYRNRVFMCNIHGSRVNQDVLERRGSGYVARHAPDFLRANDPWFRGLALYYGPDGGVFVSDWCDTGECHNYDKVQPFGRVYKVTFGQPKPIDVDLGRLGDGDLVRLQLHANDWWVRHARRLLQERAHAGKLADSVRPQLLKLLADEADVRKQLRALWALHGIGGLDEKTLLGLLDRPEVPLRSWAIRLLVEERQVSDAVATRFVELARKDEAAPVRLALASALQRLPLAQRWTIAEGLAAREEDSADPYLPLMIWYGVEPLPPADPGRASAWLPRVKIPLVRQYSARRLADKPEGVAALVERTADAEAVVQRDVVNGMYEALRGRRDQKPPAGWAALQQKLAAHPDAPARLKALMLAVIFGDRAALAALRKTASDPAGELEDRRGALQALVEIKAPELLPLLRELVADPMLRGQALRGLAGFNDPASPAVILRHYAGFTTAEKADAVTTLAARPEYALALLDAIERGQVPRQDVSAFTARQLLNFKDKKLAQRLAAVWGTIRTTAQDKVVLLERYRSLVPPDALAKADRSHGRQLYARTCAACHLLFGEGGKVGPDLTGAQRSNPDYLLTKLLDPNAVVAKDFQVSIIETKQGRIITGIVRKENDQTLTVQTPNEELTLPKGDVQERQQTAQSLMPEGMLGTLSDRELRDLVAYLAGPGQVPLPPDEAVWLFNGKNLQGWKPKGPEKRSNWTVGKAALAADDPTRLLVGKVGAGAGKADLMNGAERGVDLFTEAKFGDCLLEVEVLVPKNGDSGIYLMGEYQIQITDSFGKGKLSPGGMGGIYATAAPKVNAARPAGDWQQFQIEFRAPRFEGDKKVANARFVKVVLNGQLIHENIEVPGPTASGLTGKEAPLGPLLLQGGHSTVAYRNLKLTPRRP